MLTICRSNRMELLLRTLAGSIAEKPLSTPFVRELVVAPSPAMAQWVNYRLAGLLGVAANHSYPLPASFVWDLSRTLMENTPEEDPLEIGRLSWRIYALLPPLLEEAPFIALRAYLPWPLPR